MNLYIKSKNYPNNILTLINNNSNSLVLSLIKIFLKVSDIKKFFLKRCCLPISITLVQLVATNSASKITALTKAYYYIRKNAEIQLCCPDIMQ